MHIFKLGLFQKQICTVPSQANWDNRVEMGLEAKSCFSSSNWQVEEAGGVRVCLVLQALRDIEGGGIKDALTGRK
jgi:hypothetical protein